MFLIKRDHVRHVVLSALAKYYRTRSFVPDFLSKNRIQVIHLHSVLPHEEDGFRNLLDVLIKYHHIIPYSEAIKRVQRGDIDKPYITISFDDGFKNCLRSAEILAEYGFTGCYFVCPSVIDEVDEGKIEKFCRNGLLVPRAEFLSWNDIDMMSKNGHEFGSHTMTHSNIANLTLEDIHNEVGTSMMLLRQHVGDVKHFAWPFGRFFHFSKQAVDAVFGAGFDSCAAGERGCHISDGKSLKKEEICIRRDHVITTWPIDHVMFFLARNSRRADPRISYWPNEYSERIGI